MYCRYRALDVMLTAGQNFYINKIKTSRIFSGGKLSALSILQKSIDDVVKTPPLIYFINT